MGFFHIEFFFLDSYHDCACLRLPHLQIVRSYPSLANQSSQLTDTSECGQGQNVVIVEKVKQGINLEIVVFFCLYLYVNRGM